MQFELTCIITSVSDETCFGSDCARGGDTPMALTSAWQLKEQNLKGCSTVVGNKLMVRNRKKGILLSQEV